MSFKLGCISPTISLPTFVHFPTVLLNVPVLFQVVIFRDGTYLTLKEVFESLDLTG